MPLIPIQGCKEKKRESAKKNDGKNHFFFKLASKGKNKKAKKNCFFSFCLSHSMSEFNPTPFKGESSVPHVPEDWFTTLFIGMQVTSFFFSLEGNVSPKEEEEKNAAAA